MNATWTQECSKLFDCIIIGGGPAGLTAAEYLGRYLRDVIVIDKGSSRAALIPTSHNYPGFAEGISGKDFLKKMRDQAKKYNIGIYDMEVNDLSLIGDCLFHIDCNDKKFKARNIILATGAADEKPNLKNIDQFTYSGVIRYCPVCDGYEGKDKIIGIVGPYERIFKKACFLRTYTSKIVLFPIDDFFSLSKDMQNRLSELDIEIPNIQVTDMDIKADGVTGTYSDGRKSKVDILYPAMGTHIQTDFIKNFDLSCNDQGCIITDSHQRTNIPGLYAIGDLTVDLSQIAVATGQAAIAATEIHNSLPSNPR